MFMFTAKRHKSQDTSCGGNNNTDTIPNAVTYIIHVHVYTLKSHVCSACLHIIVSGSLRQNKSDRKSSSGRAMTQSFVSAHYT